MLDEDENGETVAEGADEIDEGGETLENDTIQVSKMSTRAWIVTLPDGDRLDPATGSIRRDEGSVPVQLISENDPDLRCPRCGYLAHAGVPFRVMRAGTPFVLGLAIPSVLDELDAPDRTPGANTPTLPLEGRKLLTFTDSRQGSATFAARQQGEAERAYVRGVIYHQVWSSARPDAQKIADLEGGIQNLEAAIAAQPSIRTLLAS